MPAAVSSLKLRGSGWGRAGKTPGPSINSRRIDPEQCSRTHRRSTPFNPGNTVLALKSRPRSIWDWDAGFFGDRLGLEFTSYRQKDERRDHQRHACHRSQGFSQSQRQNIGGIQNTGWEAGINWLTLSSRDFDWHNDFRFDGNKEQGHGPQRPHHREQHDGSSRLSDSRHLDDAARVLSTATTKTWIRSDTTLFQGPPLPTFNFSYQPSVRWRSFQFLALVTAERGAILSNSDRPYRFRQHTGDEFLSLLGPNGANTAASDSVIKYWALFDDPEKRDNVRLRQISLTYEMPIVHCVAARIRSHDGHGVCAERQDLGELPCQDPDFATNVGSDFGSALGFLADPAPQSIPLRYPVTLLRNANSHIETRAYAEYDHPNPSRRIRAGAGAAFCTRCSQRRSSQARRVRTS